MCTIKFSLKFGGYDEGPKEECTGIGQNKKLANHACSMMVLEKLIREQWLREILQEEGDNTVTEDMHKDHMNKLNSLSYWDLIDYIQADKETRKTRDSHVAKRRRDMTTIVQNYKATFGIDASQTKKEIVDNYLYNSDSNKIQSNFTPTVNQENMQCTSTDSYVFNG